MSKTTKINLQMFVVWIFEMIAIADLIRIENINYSIGFLELFGTALFSGLMTGGIIWIWQHRLLEEGD